MPPTPGWGEMVRVFGRIGLMSFGGPAAQIALMQRDLVQGARWIEDREYLSALSFCMLLPGPEAMQLATWCGWRLRGVAGGLLAGLLFVLPGAAVVLALSAAYAAWGALPLTAALFLGVKAVVVVVVVEALLRVARRALKTTAHRVVAGLAFVALFAFGLPFPLVILAAGLWGLTQAAGAARAAPAPVAPGTLRTVAVWGLVWLGPLAGLAAFGPALLYELGLFFSLLAVVTFGGAYAVLAWMTQAVVEDKGWLTLPQMIDGLGLAETTPGPLILVTEFVGFMAGHGAGGVALGVAGALVALWMTFAPCFLWIFAAAPWLDRITGAPRLAGALGAITAAVVGVIASLSVWFAAHVVFDRVGRAGALIVPDWSSVNLPALALAAAAGVMLLRWHWPLPLVLGLAAAVSGGAALA
ncbi:MAG: chromate efflux transporter [Gemmobacter sp.]|uniref:chromate efflux transporter n=1 Tax=Gemmobacter sp. TaxID=1898957 RepID=UPI00391C97CB